MRGWIIIQFKKIKKKIIIITSGGMASILSDVPDILHVQHQHFEIFLIVLGFPKGKIHFFSKVLKNYSSCQKLIIIFFFWGGWGQSQK